jgi:hypothetical protein
MSGKEGAGKLGEAAAFLRQKLTGVSWGKPGLGRWDGFIWESSQSVIGLAVRAGTVFYLRLQAGSSESGRTWDVLRLVSEPREAELSLGEQARMRAVREGWQELPFALCLTSEEILLYKTELPPNLTEREEQEAAHWELDARLTEAGLDADAYDMAVRRCGEPLPAVQEDASDPSAESMDAHTYWLAAVPRDRLQACQDDFAEQELSLRGFAVLAPLGTVQQGTDVTPAGQSVPALYLPALCAALSLVNGESSLGFLLSGRPLPVRRCRYRRLAALTLLVTLTVLSVWSFFRCARLFSGAFGFSSAEAGDSSSAPRPENHADDEEAAGEGQSARPARGDADGKIPAVVQRHGAPRPAGAADGRRMAAGHPAASGPENRNQRAGHELCGPFDVPAVL